MFFFVSNYKANFSDFGKFPKCIILAVRFNKLIGPSHYIEARIGIAYLID